MNPTYNIKKWVFRLLYILLITPSPCLLIGQGSQPRIQNFSVEDGLSSPNLIRFLQDSRGLIWLGTSYGLNRFDGTSFRSYTQEDGLCHNYILGLAEDTLGNIWICGGGFGRQEHFFCILDPVSEAFYTVEEYTGHSSPFNPHMTDIAPNYHGTILLREEQDSFYQYYEVTGNTIKPGLALSISKDLGEAFNKFNWTFKLSDTVYVTSINQAIDQDYSQYIFRVIEFDHRGEIRSHCCDSRMNGYLKTDGEHLYVICRGNGIPQEFTVYDNGQIMGKALSDQDIIFASQDYLIELGRDKLNTYKPLGDTLGPLQQNSTMGDEDIPARFDIFADSEGALWYQKGEEIQRVSQRKQYFESFFQNQGYQNQNAAIRGITTAPDGSSYIGSLNYFFIISPQGDIQRIENQHNNRNGGGILGLIFDEGNLWLAREQFGLWKSDPGALEGKIFQQNEGEILQGLLWMPYKAPDGSIWVGAGEGLLTLDTLLGQLRHFQDYQPFPSLARSSVYAFHANDQGTWLSTSSGVYLVDLLREKVLAHYSDTSKAPFNIPARHIAHLYEDSTGVFWLASKGQGLIRWSPSTGESEQLTRQNSGFSHNVLYAVYEDDYGNLWLPSDRGLNCLNKESRQVTLYLKDDGLPHSEFNTIAHHRDEAGYLYFGTQNGMIRFHPKDIDQGTREYPLLIMSVARVDGRTDSTIQLTAPVLTKHQVSLKPDDKSVNFHLAILDYNKPKGKQFSYRVEGYHKDWIYQDDPEIRIGGLPYGTYSLSLRGKASGSNIWVPYKQTIQLLVARPFYQQAWFIVLCILTVVGGGIWGLDLRTRQLRLRQKELEETVLARTEEIRLQAEELKTLDRVKSQFFANISHELRTPLTLILGPLSHILDNPENWDQSDVRKQLMMMTRNGKNLLMLVEEILELSKLDANKLELKEEVTPIGQFFEYLFFVFESQFQAKNISYDLILDISENLYLWMDRKKLEKVLNNFFSNAVKYTPKGGRISLIVTETEDQLRIKVADTGTGIHPRDLPHVFERFFQSKQADHKLYGGTGIGLALVSEFAALMEGRTWAESTLGTGSQFYFEFPKKISSPNQVILHAADINLEDKPVFSVGTDFTVLVVEDNHDMREFVSGILGKQYRVLSAQDGAEGLALLEEKGTDIHLVVSDVMMPEVDGLSLLKAVKTHPVWYHIPVVMLTALAGEKDKMTALTIGVDDYLTKPFSVPELQIRVQNLLYNYQQRREWKEKNPIKENSPAEDQGFNPRDKAWLDDLVEFIQSSLPDNAPDVQSLADAVHLSSRQLSRRLKSITGLPPSKFIREVQLQAALRELEGGTAISIGEVAFKFGFEHQSTFSSLFKNRFGKSPSGYLGTTQDWMAS